MAAGIALASLAGSAISYMGQRRSAANEQRAYESRAFGSELEAADAETQALLEQGSLHFEEHRLRNKIDATRGAQNVAVAKSGIEMSGSAAQFIARSAEEQELDALMLRFGGMAKQMGQESNAARARMNAATLRAEGKVAKSSGRAAASGTLLTGMANSALAFNSLSGGFGGSNS